MPQEPSREYTTRDDLNLMPWIIKADAEDGLTRDCTLIATLVGGNMQTVSLHISSDEGIQVK